VLSPQWHLRQQQQQMPAVMMSLMQHLRLLWLGLLKVSLMHG
jgi:hypothetical protein